MPKVFESNFFDDGTDIDNENIHYLRLIAVQDAVTVINNELRKLGVTNKFKVATHTAKLKDNTTSKYVNVGILGEKTLKVEKVKKIAARKQSPKMKKS